MDMIIQEQDSVVHNLPIEENNELFQDVAHEVLDPLSSNSFREVLLLKDIMISVYGGKFDMPEDLAQQVPDDQYMCSLQGKLKIRIMSPVY